VGTCSTLGQYLYHAQSIESKPRKDIGNADLTYGFVRDLIARRVIIIDRDMNVIVLVPLHVIECGTSCIHLLGLVENQNKDKESLLSRI